MLLCELDTTTLGRMKRVGLTVLRSTWYTRYELGRRYGLFYVIGSVTSAFGGILAFGLIQLEGKGGLRGWRWIFIVEGLITIVLGIAGYWLLVDFPDSKRKTVSSSPR